MKSHRFALAFALAAVVPASSAFAADKDDVMAVVNKATADFNGGNKAGWTEACAEQAAIIDEFPPYFWQGANTCSVWWDDFESMSKKDGMTDAAVKVADVRHVDVNGDNAYVVLTTSIGFQKAGKATTMEGASWAVTLKKGAAGWKITAWSWAAK